MSYTSISKATVDIIRSLPALRGFWPMSSIAAGGAVADLSGHDERLEYNGAPVYGIYNDTVPYLEFDGAADYLSHVDDALYDIRGTEAYIDPSIQGLTLGGWFWFDLLAHQHFFGKWDPIGDERGYKLQMGPSGSFQFFVSNNGITTFGATGPGAPLNSWQFIVGRFVPGVKTGVILNTTEVSGAAPASIFNTPIELAIGRSGVTEEYLDGRASLCFLCAAALPDILINKLFQISRPLFGV